MATFIAHFSRFLTLFNSQKISEMQKKFRKKSSRSSREILVRKYELYLSLPRSGSPSPSERLISDSRVASDHQNRHNHHRHTFQPDRCALKLVLYLCIWSQIHFGQRRKYRKTNTLSKIFCHRPHCHISTKATSRRRHAHKSWHLLKTLVVDPHTPFWGVFAQIHANTQIHKYTNTQIRKYKYTI